MKKFKYIIIAGASRGGKTTICKALSKKTHYCHIPLDPIVRSFQNNFPKIGITHADNIINVSKKLAPFLNGIIEDSPEEPLLLDTFHLVPQDYIKFINTKKCAIFFVGYPDISPHEKLKEMRTFDNREENKILTDTELLKKIEEHISQSIYLEKECKKYDLPFINTSYKRKQVIQHSINEICKHYIIK